MAAWQARLAFPLSPRLAYSYIYASGDIDGSGGRPELMDALTAMRIAVGLDQQTPQSLANGDVTPLANGRPDPDGGIGLDGALLILRTVVGLSAC